LGFWWASELGEERQVWMKLAFPKDKNGRVPVKKKKGGLAIRIHRQPSAGFIYSFLWLAS